MRGVARFRPVRSLVGTVMSRINARTTSEFIATQRERMDESVFHGVDGDRLAVALERDGYAFGLVLPDSMIEQIVEFAHAAECHADRDPARGFRLAERAHAESVLAKPILLAQYFNAGAACPSIDRLAEDPLIHTIAARHLGAPPKLVSTSLWWTFPVQASLEDRMGHAHFFHRDVDDFRFVKFFFYITDVDRGDGGHVIVTGSHLEPPVLRVSDRVTLRRFEDDEIERFYGADRIVEVVGAAGTGFVENTLCVHKGLTPTRNARLLLQLEFALFDYGLGHDVRSATQLGSLHATKDAS
jgi:hypothetical protein